MQKGIIGPILPSECSEKFKGLVISAPVFSGYVGAPVSRVKQPELVGVIKAVEPTTVRLTEQEIHVPIHTTAYAIPCRMMANAIDLGIQALLKREVAGRLDSVKPSHLDKGFPRKISIPCLYLFVNSVTL